MLSWDDEVTCSPNPSRGRGLMRAKPKSMHMEGGITSATNVVAVAETDDDDDGDSDGDPDSDRRKLSSLSIPARSAQIQSATSNRILRMPAVQVRIGLSRSTIYEAISRNEFPASISLGARAVGWLESDVDAWLDNRVSASKKALVAEWKPARIQVARNHSAKPSKE